MIEEKQQRPTSPQNIVRQRYFSCGFGNCLPCCHGYAKAGLKWLLYWHLGWGLTTHLHHFLYCLPLPLLQEDCKHPAWLLGIVAVPSLRLGQSPELLLPPPAHSTQSGLATCTLLPGLPSASRRHLTGCYCLSLLGEVRLELWLGNWGWNRQKQSFHLLWLRPIRLVEPGEGALHSILPCSLGLCLGIRNHLLLPWAGASLRDCRRRAGGRKWSGGGFQIWICFGMD